MVIVPLEAGPDRTWTEDAHVIAGHLRADWARNLTALLPPGSAEEFDDVWNAVAEYVGRIATAVP